MYSSCVRAAAVAALAVHVAAVIMTELLVLRLVVTEAGRNPELAHLEHSFQHQYVPRNTTEVNVTPPMKQQRKESTWKQNQRSIRYLHLQLYDSNLYKFTDLQIYKFTNSQIYRFIRCLI